MRKYYLIYDFIVLKIDNIGYTIVVVNKGDGIKGLILWRCGKLNSTHHGKLRQPQPALPRLLPLPQYTIHSTQAGL